MAARLGVLDVLDLLDERLLRVERLALVGLDGEEGVPGDVDGVDIEQAEVEGDELKRVRLGRLTTIVRTLSVGDRFAEEVRRSSTSREDSLPC